MTDKPTLLVVMGPGTAGPMDVRLSLSHIAELRFVTLADLSHIEVDRVRADGVTTFSESCLEPTAVLADALGLPFHSPATARALRQKPLQRAVLRDAGVDSVRHRVLDSAADWWGASDEVGLPAIVKPVDGQGSRNTYLVQDRSRGYELCAALLGRVGTSGEAAVLVEEYLAGRDCGPWGDYVSVESVVAGGEIVMMPVTGKLPLCPPFRETGQFWPAVVTADEQLAICEMNVRALRALGIVTGVTHVELKLTPQGPRVIEVNGRIGGFVNDIAIRAGRVDLVAAAGLVALGREPGLEPVRLDGVTYNFTSQLPQRTRRIVRITGGTEARKVAGVDRVVRLVEDGASVLPGVATLDVDLIAGRVATHEAMLVALRDAARLLTFDLELTGGASVSLSGTQLPSAAAFGEAPPAPELM